MVELAFVLPILVILLFGIIEFGRAYSAKIELTSAVREGARAAALGRDFATVESTTRSAATGISASDITVTAALCTGSATTASVTAAYPFTYDIPFVGRRTAGLRATGVMRCGA